MNQTNKEQGEQVREEILESIIEYIEKYGYSPTVRDIGKMTGIKSTSNVKHHLDQMIADGILETSHESSPRAIRVPGYRFVKEEMDKLYLDRCEEINELKRQVEELRKAAGKQIPQKVNEDDCCPVCGTCGADDDGITGKYCMECGQKLDWSEKFQAAGLIRGGTEESDKESEPVCYCFSWDGEEYYSELYQTKEEALQDARAEKQTFGYDEKEVYIAQAVIPDLCWNSNTEYILASMIEDLIERCGEDGENGLEVTEEQEIALGKMVDKAVSEWIARYKIKPVCYAVRNPEIWEV